MIRSGIRTFSLLLALAAPLAGPAAAQNALPALRASVTVTSDVVRIGDLIENAGAVADVPIFRSPDLGTSGAVATDRIVEAIRPHQLIDIDTRGLDRSRRDARQPRYPRAGNFRKHRAGAGRTVSAWATRTTSRSTSTATCAHLQVEPNATGDLQVLSLSYDPRSTRFDVTLDLPTSAELHRQPARFTGTALETVAAVTVAPPGGTRRSAQSNPISPWCGGRRSEGGAITDMSAVVGLAARHELRPDQPLHMPPI